MKSLFKTRVGNRHAELYKEFLTKTKGKKLVLIEIGVGYNTPGIIKYPFERMTFLGKNTRLIRINKEFIRRPQEIEDKTIEFCEDVSDILNKLK